MENRNLYLMEISSKAITHFTRAFKGYRLYNASMETEIYQKKISSNVQDKKKMVPVTRVQMPRADDKTSGRSLLVENTQLQYNTLFFTHLTDLLVI